MSLNWTTGKTIANIYNDDEKDPYIITKLKIEPKFDADLNESKFSKNDKNLEIVDNVLQLPKGYKMRLSPQHDKDQNLRLVVLGPSGSGKSTWIKNFILDYKKLYPKKEVFLFSSHDADPSIDQAKPTRIKITEEEIAISLKTRQPLFTNKNLAKSIVIFDDTYSAQSKLLVNFWDALATDLAQNARKLEIDLVFCLHNTNHSRTRFLMSESTMFVLFLRSGARAMYERILESYLGFKDKKIRKQLFNLPSRYVCFSNIAPMFILTEKMCITQDYFDKD